MSQSPELLRRLLRAKDRMDGAPQEEWPIRRLAQVSAVSVAHFAREYKRPSACLSSLSTYPSY